MTAFLSPSRAASPSLAQGGQLTSMRGAKSTGTAQSIGAGTEPPDARPEPMQNKMSSHDTTRQDTVTSSSSASRNQQVETSGGEQPVHIPSGEKQPAVEMPSGEKQPAVEMPSGEKQQAVKIPSDEKQPSVEMPSGAKQPAVEMPSGERQPVQVLSGEIEKQPAVKVLSGEKQPAERMPTQISLGVGEQLLPLLSGRIAPNEGVPAYGKQQAHEEHGITFDQYSPALADIHKSGLFDKLCDLDLKTCLGGELTRCSISTHHSMRGEPVRLGWKLRSWLANCNGMFSDFSDTLTDFEMHCRSPSAMGKPFEEAACLAAEIIVELSKCVRHRLYLPKAAQHRLEEFKQAFQDAADSPATFEAIEPGADSYDRLMDKMTELSDELHRGLYELCCRSPVAAPYGRRPQPLLYTTTTTSTFAATATIATMIIGIATVDQLTPRVLTAYTRWDPGGLIAFR